uniref:Retrovirus-related Pol polyprotein from transposon 17.6 n=1 Tax=Cajanus cajan TaxID=3821 RepID=A0A151RMY5_CAJCA|nr:Retrovirus-related Pol polyprotein from transposon 17.6 [Cajanus cajan]
MMYPPDEVHTSFITDHANFYYRVMPFDLKNAGATYQRLMDKVFHHQIRHTMEVYIDDMVVKTTSVEGHAADLAEVFNQIRKHNMRLNLEKCIFGVQGGKFLGFMITSRGIKANPEMCKAIIQMQSPQTVKEVQRLAERLVSLSRFIPRLAEKAGPIFTLLRKWTGQCEEAFKSFKVFLTTPPVHQRPDHYADLLLYLAVAESAISTIIVKEDQKVQTPIYFISRVLQDTERWYQMIEKLALALVTAARRLRTYFQSHQVVVKTDYPIKQILRKPELAGRMIAWSVELSEFGIKYESRGPLKAQCLADFVAELTPTSADEQQVWTLHVDGSSNSKGGGASVILEGPNHVTLEQSLKFGFKVTNNQAEYEALLAGLRLAHDLRARRVSCNNDSKLMVEQLNGAYQTKDTLLQRYSHLASQKISSFDEFTIHHVPREQNARVDLLSKLSNDKVVNTNDSGDLGWMASIWKYLKEGTLPEDKDEARKMIVRSTKFVIVGDELFKRGISAPLLKCMAEPQAMYVIEEIHRGICGMHSGACSMATRCKECQQFGNAHRQPPEALHQMMSSWPFAQSGMDILGPFSPAKGQLKFLIVEEAHRSYPADRPLRPIFGKNNYFYLTLNLN